MADTSDNPIGKSMRARVIAWTIVIALVLVGYAKMGQPTTPVAPPIVVPQPPVLVPIKPVHPKHTDQEETSPVAPLPPPAIEPPPPAPEPAPPPPVPAPPPVVTDAVLLSHAPLRYPPAAQRKGIEGYVVVKFTIMPDGSVLNVRVIDAVPPGWFEAAAMEEVRSRHYQPRMENGVPVAKPDVTVKLAFTLH